MRYIRRPDARIKRGRLITGVVVVSVTNPSSSRARADVIGGTLYVIETVVGRGRAAGRGIIQTSLKARMVAAVAVRSRRALGARRGGGACALCRQYLERHSEKFKAETTLRHRPVKILLLKLATEISGILKNKTMKCFSMWRANIVLTFQYRGNIAAARADNK